MLLLIIFCLLIGFLAGLLAGILGIGGGLLFVPALTYILPKVGITDDISKIAIVTSLICIIITSLSATIFHWRLNNINIKKIYNLFIGLIIGSLSGAYFIINVPNYLLEKTFAILLILTAIWLSITANKKIFSFKISNSLLTTIGVLIGNTASLLGIGGGIIIVPLLISLSYLPNKAIGTSSFCSLIIAIFSSTALLLFNKQELTTDGLLGYIHIKTAISLSTSSFLGAYYGSRLNSTLNQKCLLKLFTLFLLFVGLVILL